MNINLSENLKSLKINWIGPKAGDAFKLLKTVNTLKSLTVVVSKSTGDHVSEREENVRKYFRPVLNKTGGTRLSEALGFEELLASLEAPNIIEVHVENVNKAHSFQRPNDDRHNLERCLLDILRKRGIF